MNNLALQEEAKEVLLQLAHAIQELHHDEYTEKIPLLGNASIGEHTRHIVELFVQLQMGYATGLVNYDDRQRDVRIQENIDFATERIALIVSELCKEDRELQLVSLLNQRQSTVPTNYSRELMYNIEHCVHHQAIIKIGLLCLNRSHTEDSFGVAKSTLAYRKNVYS